MKCAVGFVFFTNSYDYYPIRDVLETSPHHKAILV